MDALGAAPPRGARHRRGAGRLGGRRPLPRVRCGHRRRVGAGGRRADGQPGRRHGALARLDRRVDRPRTGRPRPGRPLGAAARGAHLAGRPRPAPTRPRVRRRSGGGDPRHRRDAARGRQCLPRPAPRGRHPLGARAGIVRVGHHRGGRHLRGPGPTRGHRGPGAAAADRLWPVAAGGAPLHGHQRVRHGARRTGARRVRPCAARPGDRAGPRPGRGPLRGASARPGRRGRARRGAGALVPGPDRGVLAGARRRRRPRPVGWPDPRALAAGPAQPGRRGSAHGVDRRPARRGRRCSRSCAVAAGAAP